ncbi:hypothetical protein RA280_14860 [Cupriavidus sp. CV2]|uniref:hypothetical protein n=1 Tax=Cupriavidus ulmosensis TaxID=3065913 RepID=UPI00296B39A0|nr:hypothetical protein [Cupriavidus sp. CV2]MDW3683006.1 hypothetical protein [Cupriavidus sp. CV2]
MKIAPANKAIYLTWAMTLLLTSSTSYGQQVRQAAPADDRYQLAQSTTPPPSPPYHPQAFPPAPNTITGSSLGNINECSNYKGAHPYFNDDFVGNLLEKLGTSTKEQVITLCNKLGETGGPPVPIPLGRITLSSDHVCWALKYRNPKCVTNGVVNGHVIYRSRDYGLLSAGETAYRNALSDELVSANKEVRQEFKEELIRFGRFYCYEKLGTSSAEPVADLLMKATKKFGPLQHYPSTSVSEHLMQDIAGVVADKTLCPSGYPNPVVAEPQ